MALVQSLLGERLNTFVKAVMLLAVGIGLMFAVGFWEVTLMILFAALPLLVMIYATLFVVLGLVMRAAVGASSTMFVVEEMGFVPRIRRLLASGDVIRRA